MVMSVVPIVAAFVVLAAWPHTITQCGKGRSSALVSTQRVAASCAGIGGVIRGTVRCERFPGLLPVLADPDAGPGLGPRFASGPAVHPCYLPLRASAHPARMHERTLAMNTRTATPSAQIFVFDSPNPELLMEMSSEYYRECRLAGAGSVEVTLDGGSMVIISGTRYLPPHAEVGAAVSAEGVLQVLCTFGDGRPKVIMREFDAWTSYTVIRATR